MIGFKNKASILNNRHTILLFDLLMDTKDEGINFTFGCFVETRTTALDISFICLLARHQPRRCGLPLIAEPLYLNLIERKAPVFLLGLEGKQD